MPSQTKENYLKAIYFLAKKNEKISFSDLSKEMGVSIPTVNNMVKKLQSNNWVIYQKYKPIKLTAKGKKAAALIVRKHRLSEMFLEKIMGFGWEEVHDIAEDIEHVQSTKLFDRMDELLGYPTIDPHGSPIPDKQGKVVNKKYLKLTEIKEGKKVRLCGLTDSSTELLLFLNSKHIKLGTELEVLKIESFDQSITVSSEHFSTMMLSHEVCKRLLVE